MSLPIEDQVRESLNKDHRSLLLRDAFVSGWDAFKTANPDRAWWRRKSTRAALVWEHTVANAVAAFNKDRGIKTISHYDTVSFIIDNLVLLRIKKASVELRTSNVQTQLAALFHDHECDLFGFAGLQRVEAAYVLNRLATDIAWVGIVARESNKPLWHFELDEGGAATATTPLPLPAPMPTPPSKLVRLKADQKESKSEPKKQ